MVFFFWQMLEVYCLENIVLTEHKLRCLAIPSQKRVLNQIQVRSVIEPESFNSHLQLLFISLLTTKRRHQDCDKVNPGAHDKGSCWIIRLSLGLVLHFAGVASFSNQVIARKLERQQNKMKEGGGGGDKRFPFLPISSRFISGIFFALVPAFSTNSRRKACYAGYIWLFVFLSFFLFFFSSIFFFSHNNFATITKKKPVFNGHSWLIADWPA